MNPTLVAMTLTVAEEVNTIGFIYRFEFADGTVPSVEYQIVAPESFERRVTRSESKNVLAGASMVGTTAIGFAKTVMKFFFGAVPHSDSGEDPMIRSNVPPAVRVR